MTESSTLSHVGSTQPTRGIIALLAALAAIDLLPASGATRRELQRALGSGDKLAA